MPNPQASLDSASMPRTDRAARSASSSPPKVGTDTILEYQDEFGHVPTWTDVHAAYAPNFSFAATAAERRGDDDAIGHP
jgi:hypothetical protein